MSIQIELTQFTGPLDLLLGLVNDQKLPINEVSLSQVTEQYLGYLDSMDDSKAEELADFLVIAARLLLLKSKSLLPTFAPEEDEGPSLEDQLRRYQAFVEASKSIHKRWMEPTKTIFRTEPARKAEGFVPPANATVESMHQSMVQLLHKIKPPKPLPKTTIDRNISLKQTISRIRDMLKSKKKISFNQALSGAKNKTEVIVGFLALLELVKQQTVHLNQDEHFGDILIHKV
jgi:segregation and condensation protein A